jgi:PadR family transcriptional regulator, regulatory protein PadR
MPENNTALVQGTLDMLILNTLALEPMHAHGIGLRIEQISQGVFQVNPGSLFPAFKRLERAGSGGANGARQKTIAAPSTTF